MTDRSYDVALVAGPPGGHEQLRDRLGDRYEVTTIDSPPVPLSALSAVDCVVAIGTAALESVLDDVPGDDIVIVGVLDDPDHSVIELCSREPNAELILATETQGEQLPASTVQDIEARVDDRYERSISQLSEVVLAASRSLMGAAVDEVDTKIEWELRSVGQQVAADHAAFYRYDESDDDLVCTHAWSETETTSAETIPAASFPGFDTLEAFDPATFPVIDDKSTEESGNAGGDEIDVPDGFVGDIDLLTADSDDDNADETQWPAYLDAQGFEAFAAVPVVIDWSLYGVLAVGCERERTWTAELCRELRTLGEHIGYTLIRRQRRQELETQNERLERFASVISHDLQNPISVITGYTELAVETGDTEPLDDVLEAAYRMEGLVDDLLTLAREGDAVGETTPVTLSYVAENAWRAVDSPEATLEIDDTGDTFEADDSRFQQVLENLFKNAVEHAGEDVTIRAERTPTGIAIEDDGPGIPEPKRDEVFEEGYTGGDGTGLGLAIVNSVVEGHGWTIDVEEGIGGGARFEIEFDS